MADKQDTVRKLRMNEARFRIIHGRTQGHCHFCGDKLVFELRGKWHGSGSGAWEADHVFQLGRGGADVIENYLPACSECNRARWFNTGAEIRHLLSLGLVAKEHIEKDTPLGKSLAAAHQARQVKNAGRRKIRPVTETAT